jgi:acyl carrier protein
VQHKAPHPRRERSIEPLLRALLAETLGLPKKRVDGFTADTGLFGALSEFDSMAVAHFLTALEEKLAVVIEDDDVEAEDFATFGTLLAFAERLAAR